MKKIIVANWKCNPATLKEAEKMVGDLKKGLRAVKNEVVVCPPFCYLGASAFARQKASFCGLAFGSQNCFWEQSGAFTGEVAPTMLKSLGCKYVILGHSERVMTMGETNEMTAKKVKTVLAVGLTPIVCIGETHDEKKQGKTLEIIEKEFKESLQKINKSQASKVIIAYEPLWAIGAGPVRGGTSNGAGKNCSADDAITVALYIKKLADKIFGKQARAIKVLYGGSVSGQNANDYLSSDWLSGLLVGSASLDIKEFLKICKSA